MLFGTFIPPIVKANFDELSEIDLENYEVRTQGLIMKPEDLKNAFGGELESRFMPPNLPLTELTMHHVVIDGNQISMDLVLSPVSTLGTVIDVEYKASVIQLNGHQNDLLIQVIEHFDCGRTNEINETFRIENNGSGMFAVGDYQIFVKTQGNTHIREIYLESNGTRFLPIRGTLYSGNRDGTVVIETKGDMNGYKLLLFKINRIPEAHNLLLPTSYSQGLYKQSQTKIYLLNEKGEIHLFEFKTPEALLSPQPDDLEALDHIYDLIWAMDFVENTFEIFEYEALTDELIQYLGLSLYDEEELFDPFGLGTWTTNNYGTAAFVVTHIIGNDRTVFSSRPAMRRRHNNIGRGANNFFDVEFRIVESRRFYTRNGTGWRHIQTDHGRSSGTIDYRNVEVKIQLGNHTQINNFTTHGRARRHNTIGTTLMQNGSSIRSVVLSGVGVPSSAQTALNLISDAVRNTSQNVSLGSRSTYARTGRWTQTGIRLPNNYRFYYNTASNNGHRLHIQVNAGRYGGHHASTATVHGAARVEFDVFIGNVRSGSRRNIARSFTYTVDRRN